MKSLMKFFTLCFTESETVSSSSVRPRCSFSRTMCVIYHHHHHRRTSKMSAWQTLHRASAGRESNCGPPATNLPRQVLEVVVRVDSSNFDVGLAVMCECFDDNLAHLFSEVLVVLRRYLPLT
eukprot:m.175180 g.175180  ORF g.175180 m.175180 type:complete len:122 (-) comp53315_c0_seq22:2120-2485(-)